MAGLSSHVLTSGSNSPAYRHDYRYILKVLSIDICRSMGFVAVTAGSVVKTDCLPLNCDWFLVNWLVSQYESSVCQDWYICMSWKLHRFEEFSLVSGSSYSLYSQIVEILQFVIQKTDWGSRCQFWYNHKVGFNRHSSFSLILLCADCLSVTSFSFSSL